MMNCFPIVIYCYIYEIQIMQYFSSKVGVTSLLESQKLKIFNFKELCRRCPIISIICIFGKAHDFDRYIILSNATIDASLHLRSHNFWEIGKLICQIDFQLQSKVSNTNIKS